MEREKTIKVKIETWKKLKYLTVDYEKSIDEVIEMLIKYYEEDC